MAAVIYYGIAQVVCVPWVSCDSTVACVWDDEAAVVAMCKGFMPGSNSSIHDKARSMKKTCKGVNRAACQGLGLHTFHCLKSVIHLLRKGQGHQRELCSKWICRPLDAKYLAIAVHECREFEPVAGMMHAKLSDCRRMVRR